MYKNEYLSNMKIGYLTDSTLIWSQISDFLLLRGEVHAFSFFNGDWYRDEMLRVPDLPVSSFLGRDVAITGDYVVAGASGTNWHEPNGGTIHIFERTKFYFISFISLTHFYFPPSFLILTFLFDVRRSINR